MLRLSRWLAIQNCLTTGNRLVKWGYEGKVCCVFCRSGVESRGHLFFKCSYSRRIWKEGMSRCNVLNPPVDWDEVVKLGMRKWNKKSLNANICRLVLSSTVYNIWRNRNEIKHGNHPKTEEHILQKIFWEVRTSVGERKV